MRWTIRERETKGSLALMNAFGALSRNCAIALTPVRIATWLGAAFMLLVIGITAVLIGFRHDAIISSTRKEIRTLNVVLAEETDRSLQSVRLLVDSVVEQIEIKGIHDAATLNTKMAAREIHEDLRARIAGVPQLDAVTIVNTDGFIVNFSRKWPVADNDLSDRAWFKSLRDGARGSLYLSESLIDRATFEPTIYLGRRLSAPNGDFIGLVLAAVQLQHFDRLYTSLKLPESDSVALWRRDGILLTQYPPSSPPNVSPLNAFLPPDVNTEIEGTYEDTIQRGDGIKQTKIVASAKTPQFPVQVTIARDKDAVLAAWKSDAVALVLAAFVILIATGMLLAGLIKHLRTLDATAVVCQEREQAILARNEIEEILRQSQKMEVVGQLTGGIAHDFNNVLTVVTSGLHVLQRKLDKGDTDVGTVITRILDATSRAASLTRRLLALSSQKPTESARIDPNELLADLIELIGHAIEGTVTIETSLASDLWPVRVDESQFENVILNLAVNARDAMKSGGLLSISAENHTVPGENTTTTGIEPGDYLLVVVTDTGVGMNETVLSKAFEPFFTTKAVGEGTGLGLSQVMSFARQSGGYVKVLSEVGKGTTFQLFIPRLKERPTIVPDEEKTSKTSFSALQNVVGEPYSVRF